MPGADRNRKPLVLIVDDDAQTRRVFSEALSEGFQVDLASDAAGALTALARRVPDAVVLDMAMPGQSGLAVLQQLRAEPRTKQVPVLVVSAVGRDNELWAGHDWGWDGYLEKPVSLDKLTANLKALIARGKRRSRAAPKSPRSKR